MDRQKDRGRGGGGTNQGGVDDIFQSIIGRLWLSTFIKKMFKENGVYGAKIWIDGWMSVCGQIDEWIDKYMDGWVGKMHGWV